METSDHRSAIKCQVTRIVLSTKAWLERVDRRLLFDLSRGPHTTLEWAAGNFSIKVLARSRCSCAYDNHALLQKFIRIESISERRQEEIADFLCSRLVRLAPAHLSSEAKPTRLVRLLTITLAYVPPCIYHIFYTTKKHRQRGILLS